MFYEVNRDNLRFSYSLLRALQGSEYRASRAYEEAELKRRIRAFNRQPRPPRIISDDGMDGYIEIDEMPAAFADWSKEDVSEWFRDNRVIRAFPSAYDCTGQAFTSWFKIVRRHGRWFVYHCICFDV